MNSRNPAINLSSSSPDVVICMPAFNESEGILSYLDEIHRAFSDVLMKTVVVNDCSRDETRKVLTMAIGELGTKVVDNEVNLGHGPSTLVALSTALALRPRIVVSTDGDGHFSGREIRRVFDEIDGSQFQIIEGVRIHRTDPVFRAVSTWFSRLLLRLLGSGSVRDANTPLRAYRSSDLQSLLALVPPDSLTPNLMFTLVSRVTGMAVNEIDVEWRQRLGSSSVGTTWRGRFEFFPTRRFLTFCFRASKALISFSLTKLPRRAA